MTGATPTPTPAATPGRAWRSSTWGVARSSEDRMVAGVAGGIARRLGVDAVLVRLAFIVLATAGLAGLVLYALGATLLPPDTDRPQPLPRRTPHARYALALGFVVTGLLLLLKSVSIWFADSLTWSLWLAACGSALVWTRAADDERERFRRLLGRVSGGQLPAPQQLGRMRLLAGIGLLLLGMLVFLVGSADLSAIADQLVAVAVTGAGAALLVGPWVQRLASQVAEERRERIRSEERAEMAAHLHDSVLQTLALIQRAGSREDMVRLARSQERELRSWLFGRHPGRAATRFAEAVQDAAGRVEERYGVAVEVVLVSDTDLDADLRALVDAAAEAMTNAAKHSGADTISVFAEVTPTDVEIFVRDEGKGFDPGAVPPDRRGLADSIHRRMERHGGTVSLFSEPGGGTEVELRMPRRGRHHEEDDDDE